MANTDPRVFTEWSDEIYTDRTTKRLILRDAALTRFLTTVKEALPAWAGQVSGYAEHKAPADGWAFGRSWFMERLNG